MTGLRCHLGHGLEQIVIDQDDQAGVARRQPADQWDHPRQAAGRHAPTNALIMEANEGLRFARLGAHEA